MDEPDEPFVIPMGGRQSGNAKWVVLAAAVVVVLLGSWLGIEHLRDSAAAEERAAAARREEAELEKRREERRKQAGSGIPLSEAHKPPPGYEPPKSRIPSKELFADAPQPSGLLPIRLPGGLFGIQLPATWDHTMSGGLMIIKAPEDHFRIVVATGTQADDGNTQQAIESIGAVNCNWQRGDGPSRGQLGSQRIPAYFNEGLCGHTDGYGLIWIVRVYAGDDVTSLVARYSPTAGENAEDVLIGVLRSIVPVD